MSRSVCLYLVCGYVGLEWIYVGVLSGCTLGLNGCVCMRWMYADVEWIYVGVKWMCVRPRTVRSQASTNVL